MYRYHVFYLIIIITSIFIKKISSIPGIKMFLEQFSTYVILKFISQNSIFINSSTKSSPIPFNRTSFEDQTADDDLIATKILAAGQTVYSVILYIISPVLGQQPCGPGIILDGSMETQLYQSPILGFILALSWFSIAFFDDEFLIIRYFFFFFFHIINILMTY